MSVEEISAEGAECLRDEQLQGQACGLFRAARAGAARGHVLGLPVDRDAQRAAAGRCTAAGRSPRHGRRVRRRARGRTRARGQPGPAARLRARARTPEPPRPRAPAARPRARRRARPERRLSPPRPRRHGERHAHESARPARSRRRSGRPRRQPRRRLAERSGLTGGDRLRFVAGRAPLQPATVTLGSVRYRAVAAPPLEVLTPKAKIDAAAARTEHRLLAALLATLVLVGLVAWL